MKVNCETKHITLIKCYALKNIFCFAKAPKLKIILLTCTLY